MFQGLKFLFCMDQVPQSRRSVETNYQEPFTFQEENVQTALRAQAHRSFDVGFGSCCLGTFLATKRLHIPLSLSLALGVGVVGGLWLTSRSLESSVELMLSMRGSQLQRELVNIMLKRYHDDPWIQKRLSKHFYVEEVYGDSLVDRPILRWRYRNLFGDAVASYGEETDSKENDIKETTPTQPKHVYGVGAKENPFDVIFGDAEICEDAPKMDTTPTSSSRRQSRRERRSRRRHRDNESDV